MFRLADDPTIVDFMRAHSFATLVSTGEDGVPVATHIPLVVDRGGDAIVLRGHLARANPQWRTFAADRDVLAIFQGPHAYVSPTAYDSRLSVPTWNYTAVHAYGRAALVTDPAEVEEALMSLVAQYESTYRAQWDSLPERYRSGMKQGLVAFTLRVARIDAAWKLSQNRTPEERARIGAALAASGDPDASAVAGLMTRIAAQAGLGP